MTDPQQAIFAALADPTRRRLVRDLAIEGPKTATMLASEYPITRQAILKHLAVLERARLVCIQKRGREKRYVLTPEPLTELEQFVRHIEAVWDARLLRLKDYVENEMAEE